MKVSVVLTTYNRAAALRDSLSSILEQSFEDFELIVSDDCSPDATEQVVAEFAQQDERVRYRRNETNLGMPGNLNAGISASRGEFIANLHDGDLFDRDLLRLWVTALETCPDAAFVFNAYADMDEDGRVRRMHLHDVPPCMPGHLFLERNFFKSWRFQSPVWGTVMARKSAYEAVGLFDERFGFWSDIDMWMRLAEHFSVAYVSRPLIRLAPGHVLPRDITPEEQAREHQTTERIWLAARRRHYARRPARRRVEFARHYAHRFAWGAFRRALRLRRRFIRHMPVSRRRIDR